MKHNPKIPAGGGDYTSLASSQHLTDSTHTNTSPKTHQINNNDTDSSQSHNNLESFHPSNTSHSSLVLKSLFHKYSFSSLWHSFYSLFTSPKDIKTYTRYKDISLFAILNICFLICVYTPFAIYSSDMSQFDAKDSLKTLSILCGFFIFFALVLVYTTSFLYRSRFLKLAAWSWSILLVIGIIDTFIFTGDYGVMDNFILQNPTFVDSDFRKSKIPHAIFTFILSVVIVAAVFKYLKSIFQILFITLFLSSVVYGYKILHTQGDALTQRKEVQNTQAPYEQELFTYAKDKPNIVVFVLDMFSGSHMKPILEQFPHIKEYLDGFILFDNAISTSNATIHSIATLIGGEHYSVYNMNARGDNLAHSITESFGRIGDTFIKNGYDVGVVMATASEPKEALQAYNKDMFVVYDSRIFNDFYMQQRALSVHDFIFQERERSPEVFQLISVGLFRFVPERFRNKIYRDGSWLFYEKSRVQALLSSIDYASAFYAFTHIHQIGSNKPTFKYLHSVMTHTPYSMYYDSGKCSHFKSQSVWEEYPHTEKMFYKIKKYERDFYQHYDTEVCAFEYLNDFLGWLKSEGIYDNTQIFVVSDHSGNDSINIPEKLYQTQELAFPRPDILLLFKDFNAKGELQINHQLMANYDMASIFCASLPQGCPNVPPHILQNYPPNRSLISTTPIHFDIKFHKNNEWILDKLYRVQGNIYDEKNWQEIDSHTLQNETQKTH